MAMYYKDMCEEIRAFMIEEVELDAENLYGSSYFREAGVAAWKEHLLEACRSGDDATLAAAIDSREYLKTHHSYLRMGKPVTAAVPITAPKTIADSNFSRFYLRALCRLAIEKGVPSLIGYRAMAVEKPRSGSQEKIGMRFDPKEMLADLRATMAKEPTLGMPPGVGSGILACLPG